MIKEMFDLSV